MRRFIVRRREGYGMSFGAKSIPQLIATTWWDVIDTGNDNQVMSTKRSEQLAYKAAKELERSHTVREGVRKKR